MNSRLLGALLVVVSSLAWCSLLFAGVLVLIEEPAGLFIALSIGFAVLATGILVIESQVRK